MFRNCVLSVREQMLEDLQISEMCTQIQNTFTLIPICACTHILSQRHVPVSLADMQFGLHAPKLEFTYTISSHPLLHCADLWCFKCPGAQSVNKKSLLMLFSHTHGQKCFLSIAKPDKHWWNYLMKSCYSGFMRKRESEFCFFVVVFLPHACDIFLSSRFQGISCYLGEGYIWMWTSVRIVDSFMTRAVTVGWFLYC